MNFSLTALNLTYPLLAGFVFCIAYILGLKRDLSVLETIVKMNETNQEKINDSLNKKIDRIESKLDEILEILYKNGKK